jgi:NitT/TauT family transport system permease protein
LEARLETLVVQGERREAAWRVIMPIAVGLPFLICWELYARVTASPLVPPPSRIAAALPGVLGDPATWGGLLSSDVSLLLGYAVALVLGIPLGLLMGRLRRLDLLLGPVVDLAMVTPMVVVMPVVLMALGLTRQSQIVVILLFALPFVTVPCRAGVRAIPAELIEMPRSFGASELQLWREVLLPGSIPSIATGLRLGFGQAITGMVVVELTLLAIGIGQVLLHYESSFHYPELFGIVLLIIAQSVVVMAALRAVERRFAGGHPSGGLPAVAAA